MITFPSPQKFGRGFGMDPNKVRTVFNFSVSRSIHIKLNYLTLNTDSYAKVHTEITPSNHCYTEATESLLIQLRIKQTRQKESDIQPSLAQNNTTTHCHHHKPVQIFSKFCLWPFPWQNAKLCIKAAS